MKIADNVYMLTLDGDKGKIYPTLILDGDDALLVDAGFPGYYDALCQALAEAGVTPGGITRLLFTHQDMDHIGCVREIREAAPDVRVLAHAAEAPYIEGTATPVKLAKMEAYGDALPDEQKAFLATFRAAFENRRTPIDVRLADGDTLPLAGGVHIIHTPGHTPGHICLWIPAARLIVAGDALNMSEGQLIGPAERHSLDIGLARASLAKLMACGAERVICYHGGLYEGDVAAALRDLDGGADSKHREL